jgi:hypothetical protein
MRTQRRALDTHTRAHTKAQERGGHVRRGGQVQLNGEKERKREREKDRQRGGAGVAFCAAFGRITRRPSRALASFVNVAYQYPLLRMARSDGRKRVSNAGRGFGDDSRAPKIT